MNKKAQTGGLITGIVMGVAGLVIAVIIAFIIVGTLSGGDLLTSGRSSFSVTNESDSTGDIAFANTTGYTLTQVGGNNLSFSLTTIWADWNQTNGTQNGIGNNPTGYNVSIPLTNATLSSAGIVTNATSYVYPNLSVSYSHQAKAAEELSTERLSGNFTEGIDNVSSKIPTVLLIAAIVLILGVLVFLVVQWQRMRLGGGGGSTSL